MIEDVFIARQSKCAEADATEILAGLQECGFDQRLTNASRIIIKPNLTYPRPKAGVTTTPSGLQRVVAALSHYDKEIVIVESDGGNHAWSGMDALEAHCHLIPRGRGRGVRLCNLSQEAVEEVPILSGDETIMLPLPKLLLDQRNVMVTMPVPKRHVMTGVSLGLKNQWGCIPDSKRLRYHYAFDDLIVGINKIIDPIAVADGTYFLDETGPMDGRPVPKDVFLIGSTYSVSVACCQIMNVPFMSIRHHRRAVDRGFFPPEWGGRFLGLEPAAISFKSKLNLTLMDRLAQISFDSRFLTHLLYISKLAKPVHEVVYAIRGRPKDIVPQW